MNKIITMLTVSIIGYSAQAQSSETENVTSFSRIEATDGVEIHLIQGNTHSISTKSENESLVNVTTEVVGNTLKIKKTDRNTSSAKIYISAPVISGIIASSQSMIFVDKWLDGDNIKVSLSSGAFFTGNIKSRKLTLDAKSDATIKTRIETDELSCRFKSYSKIILSGSAKKSSISTGSGVIFSARNFISNDIYVNAGEQSLVALNSDSRLCIAMDSTAKVTYYGKPRCVQIPTDAIIINKNPRQTINQ